MKSLFRTCSEQAISQKFVFPALVFAAFVLSGCGVMANSKPIPVGSPTATIHFGPVGGLGKGMQVTVFDNDTCSRDGFARYKTINSILGSEIDIDVPADKEIFVMLAESQQGFPAKCGGTVYCVASHCESRVSFRPQDGMKYSGQLVTGPNKCDVVIFETSGGQENRVAKQTQLKPC